MTLGWKCSGRQSLSLRRKSSIVCTVYQIYRHAIYITSRNDWLDSKPKCFEKRHLYNDDQSCPSSKSRTRRAVHVISIGYNVRSNLYWYGVKNWQNDDILRLSYPGYLTNLLQYLYTSKTISDGPYWKHLSSATRNLPLDAPFVSCKVHLTSWLMCVSVLPSLQV